MKVVFMGTPDFSVGTLRELAKAGHEIAGVISQPDKPKGRGKNLQPTPVKEAAMELGLPVYQPQKVRDPEFIQVMKELNPDVIVVVAFGQIRKRFCICQNMDVLTYTHPCSRPTVVRLRFSGL